MRMKPTKRDWSGFLLGVCTALLAGVLWLGISSPPPAFGQIPDSGAQRGEMIMELRGVNRQLKEIAGILREIRDAKQADTPQKAKPAASPKRP